MSFNKSDLIAHVTAQTSFKKVEAVRAINAIFSGITKALQEGNEVRLVGFGTFVVKDKPAFQGRNPRTGEALEIAASKKAVFRPGIELKKSVNGGA